MGEFKKLIKDYNQTKEQIRKGLESSIISGLAKRAHITKVTIDKTDILVSDIFYEIFENPAVKWMVIAYLKEEMLRHIEEAKKEFDLKWIKETMKSYPEREWWTQLERIVPILEKWFGDE